MKRLLLSAAILALAACDRTPGDTAPEGQTDSEQQAAETTAEVAEVPISDAYPVGAAVRSIDFWSHPNVPFASLILVGTGDGIIALNVETGEEISRIEGFAADDIAVGYDGDQGYVAALDLEAGEIVIAQIDNTSMELKPLATIDKQATGLCPSLSNGRTFFVTSEEGVSVATLDEDENVGLKLTEVARELTDCLPIDDGERTTRIASKSAYRDKAILLKRNEAEANNGVIVRYIVSAGNSPSGLLTVHTGNTGEQYQPFRFGASFDYPAVTSATALGAGYGNYGGVYRDGIVALGDENGMVSLVPWNSVVSALGLELGERVDPRNIYPEEDDPFAIEIDIVDPSAN